MRTILKISGVLSWFNLVVWGIAICYALLITLAAQSPALLVVPFLLSVIVLHSYAALQLHRSIKNPVRPLSSQTPVGIRFIGAVALFFGLTGFVNGITLLQNPKEILDTIHKSSFPMAKDFTIFQIRISGVLALFVGLCVSVNVILNFRLLRWYHFMKGMM